MANVSDDAFRGITYISLFLAAGVFALADPSLGAERSAGVTAFVFVGLFFFFYWIFSKRSDDDAS